MSTTIPYEGIVILQPDTALDAQKELFRKNKSIVEAHKGAVNTVETWGRRLLANPIQKSARGIFFHVTFNADNKAVAELERTMGINDNVLRFIHVRLPEGTDLKKHMENFKSELAAGVAREKERAERAQARRLARKADEDLE